MLGNIKRLCAAKQISIQQLETEAGIAAGTVGRWGRDGKLMPSIDKVKRVADVLGVTVDELLRDDPEQQDA